MEEPKTLQTCNPRILHFPLCLNLLRTPLSLSMCSRCKHIQLHLVLRVPRKTRIWFTHRMTPRKLQIKPILYTKRTNVINNLLMSSLKLRACLLNHTVAAFIQILTLEKRRKKIISSCIFYNNLFGQ